MSILIKGMEMPKSCGECLDIGWHYVFDCRLDDAEEGERLPNCPLVPVPPHGRLVAMDEIEERIDSCCDDIDCSKTMCNKCAVQIVMDKVFDAPTIIPAEEGE